VEEDPEAGSVAMNENRIIEERKRTHPFPLDGILKDPLKTWLRKSAAERPVNAVEQSWRAED